MSRLVSLIALLPLIAAALTAAPGARVLVIAGPPSHGWNKHEFPAGAELLAQSLNRSGLPVRADWTLAWPDDPALVAEADAIVLYSDGLGRHVANGRSAEIEAARQRGAGLAALHFAIEPSEPELKALFAKAIGGYFEAGWSVNPVWRLTDPILADHPITRGVGDLAIEDEWYYHLRLFPGITPILSAHPPLDSLGADGPRSGNPHVRSALENRIPQILAWTHVDASGARGFGFTGGHFHRNWANDAFRGLVLNAIAWTAGIEIPETGITSETPILVEYQTIDEAIARGDAEDTARHLALEPEQLNRPGRGKLTPLQQAVLRKKAAIAALLLERGADPNLDPAKRQTPLHAAVSRDLPETVSKLLAHGADPSIRDSQGWTPLHLAAAKGNVPAAQALIEGSNGRRFLSAAGGTPLHEAAASGSAKMVRLLLDAGEDPSVVSDHGKTARDIAIEFENEAALELLNL